METLRFLEVFHFMPLYLLLGGIFQGVLDFLHCAPGRTNVGALVLYHGAGFFGIGDSLRNKGRNVSGLIPRPRRQQKFAFEMSRNCY